VARLAVIGLLLGIALGCSHTEKHCEDFTCDDCRRCAKESWYGCRDAWWECRRDPSCEELEDCLRDCDGLAAEFRVGCERQCREDLSDGEALYEEALGCIDDVCAASCE